MSSADAASTQPAQAELEATELASRRNLLWTRQRSPEWRPRRASVATCQHTSKFEQQLAPQQPEQLHQHQVASRHARSRSQEVQADTDTCCSADARWSAELSSSGADKQRRSLIYSMALKQLAWQAAWLSSGQRLQDRQQVNCSCCCITCAEPATPAERESAHTRSINGTCWSSRLSSADRLTDYLASSSSCCCCCVHAPAELSSAASLARLSGDRRASLTVVAASSLQPLAADAKTRPIGEQRQQPAREVALRGELTGTVVAQSPLCWLAKINTPEEEKMLAGNSGSVRAKSQTSDRINDAGFSSKSDCSAGPDEQRQRAAHLDSQDLNLESLIVESWLDDHPNFVHDYFMRKADNKLIDSWLVSQAKVRSNVRSSSVGHPVARSSLSRHQEVTEPCESRASPTPRSAPVRKISATDLESRTGGGVLRPIVSTMPDGRPTFLTQSDKQSSVASEHGQALANQRELDETADVRTDEVRLVFDLVKNICDDLDIGTLLHKILKNIAILINADKSSLFLVCGQPGDPNRHLMSQLFNVDQSGDDQPAASSIIIPWGVGLVGYVAQSGESVNIANCYEDPRFTNAVDQRTGYTTKHMLCAPIYDKRNEIVGVAQVINKRNGQAFSREDEIKFKQYLQFCGIGLRNAQSYENCQLENKRNQVLLDLARMVFEEQSTIEQVVHRIMLHIQSLLECQRCQVLLLDDGSGLEQHERPFSCKSGAGVKSCRGISADDRAGLLELEAQNERSKPEWRPHCRSKPARGGPSAEGTVGATPAKSLGQTTTAAAEQALKPASSSLSMDGELLGAPRIFSLVFNLDSGPDNSFVMHHHNKATDLLLKSDKHPFPVNIGITSHVARTGETLNIEDAHQDPRFDVSIDQNSSFQHKSILCMPIKDGHGRIIGVSQLINKKDGRVFNKNDENLFEAFAIFCGLGIHNTLMYERVLKIMAKQRVTFEVLSYHASAPLEEAKRLQAEKVPSCFALNLASLKFNDFSLDEQLMLKSCLRFFLDLDLMRRFQIDRLVFCRWILSVQKNYRKVTYHPVVGGSGLRESPVRYHNWRHAFNVSQMMFAIITNTQICQVLGELETLALMIACLCHDLDHRGTNNSFQIKSASPLAELYSTSTMEHHHFDQCVMILNSQGNQILANLSPDEYSRVIALLEEAILATDLASYFRKRDTFFKLVNDGQLDWQSNAEHRSLLRCMLMTACDVAAITKPWPVQKVVANLVMSEFYQQGDIERQELKIEPIDMMNRDKMNKLPEMQIDFIDSICAPIYTAFKQLFPSELGPLLEGCLSNRSLWSKLAAGNNSESSYEIDNLPHLDDISVRESRSLSETNELRQNRCYNSHESLFMMLV